MTKLNQIDQDTILGRLQKNAELINYHREEIEPFYKEMEPWEEHEYRESQNERLTKLDCQIAALKESESVFNEVLMKYNLTVSTFIAKNI